MRVSRDARWVLGLVLLIGLGASVLRWRAGGAEEVGRAYVAPEFSLPPSRARIAVLDKRERERDIRDRKGRMYRLDQESLTVCGVRVGMNEAEVRRILGPEENRTIAAPVRAPAGVLTWPARGVTVRGFQLFSECGLQVTEVSGPSLESHGLVIGRHSDARDVVKARLANAMGALPEGFTPESEGGEGPVRSARARGRSVDGFSTYRFNVWVVGPDSLQFTLGPEDKTPCGNDFQAHSTSTHPVDYANFMSLHGHPVESWTPLRGCAEELTRSRYDSGGGW